MGALENLEHYTYEDYKLWEGDWELIDGVAYTMAPSPVKRHQSLTVKISTQLEEWFEDCGECEVLVEEDYKIAEDTVVRPDIAVVCDDENENYIAKAPLIIVEIISPKTARRDEVVKFSLYETEGVKYYVLIYMDDLRAKIFKHNGERFIKEGDFSHETYEFTESKCPAKIDFKRVFKKYRKI
ncbi:Uma2 family endonuclease [Nitratiruptor tergarcus]|uniref:Uncharacterized protein conserved in cyanobacteria n=1 Tax=Nitratiruptor tergarcus DSM 16512 TaxID=1069081 RepID=A0A1W1WSU4_9BACT|nr:Uma2 family endonuclease [Nitratiruptor tergarcus]SMC08793.1 Uncharacterized protein conserved in cyanobacteria [Nitratiruptor tergarcus DSM 16512]